MLFYNSFPSFSPAQIVSHYEIGCVDLHNEGDGEEAQEHAQGYRR